MSRTEAWKNTPRLASAASWKRSSPGCEARRVSEVERRAAWREVERTMWDGIGLVGEEEREVRVIGSRRGVTPELESRVRRDESL